MPLVVRVIQWEIGDVAADVTDPDDRGPRKMIAPTATRYQESVSDTIVSASPAALTSGSDARRRHVDLLPDGSGTAVDVIVEFFAHWMYTSAATKVRANMSSPTMLT